MDSRVTFLGNLLDSNWIIIYELQKNLVRHLPLFQDAYILNFKTKSNKQKLKNILLLTNQVRSGYEIGFEQLDMDLFYSKQLLKMITFFCYCEF